VSAARAQPEPFYRDPFWDGSTPGTLAVVIGASVYDHLPGGPGTPARDAYGLGQLAVSALTAHRFAEWLRDSYRLTGCPLSECWLLASPTAEEVAADPALGGVAAATFDNCADAIALWFQSSRRLTAAVARASRLVFFFSGHGMEMRQDEQLLLPGDYLRPPQEVVNRAINTGDLRQAMATSPVPVQLYFLDACRNDHPRLRQSGVTLRGTEVLNPVANAYANAELDAAVLYAATAGTQAFGPTAVADGLTLYGRALLEGLTEPPDPFVECDQVVCTVRMHHLQEYMNSRVAELLREFGASTRQRILLGGQSMARLVVAEARGAEGAGGGTRVPSVRESERHGTVTQAVADVTTGSLVGEVDGSDLFGDPDMSAVWAQRRLYRADDEAVTPDHALVRVDQRGGRVYDLTVRIDGDPIGYVAEIGEPRLRFRCLLPWVGPGARYLLRLTRDESGQLIDVACDLDSSSEGLLGRVADAWRANQERSRLEAARMLPDAVLEVVAAGAADSPLPAVVGGLLRLGLQEHLPSGWTDDLLLHYPDWGDPAVLGAETQLRVGVTTEEAAGLLQTLHATGFPITGEAIGLLHGQLRFLLAQPGLDEDARSRGEVLRKRVEPVFAHLQPGGLFPVLVDADV
jgi:hypothetical protein